ncbi:MAG: hypothetical protein J0I98_06455 [Mesorhizobium sp.]|nr:hypothetical protein [Mesorhizobium sp.]MBN9242417.1 hypothetical protein [Mesorhizobium sp.]
MPEPHDWTADPRPLSDCLKDFNRIINGGRVSGARMAGQTALGIRSADTYAALLKSGYSTPWEAVLRLAMVEAERRGGGQAAGKP